MTPDDHRTGLGALIAALILSVASLVLWIVAVSRGRHTLYATTSFDAPEAGTDIGSQTRTAP